MENKEKTIVITFGGTECEDKSLLFVASKLSRMLNKNHIDNILFNLNDSELRNNFKLKMPQDSIFFILEPYYYIDNSRFDIREILEKEKLKYTGPRIKASKITADKELSKKVINFSNVKSIRGEVCETVDRIYKFISDTKFPSYIVKPNDKGGGEDVSLINIDQVKNFDFTKLLKKHGALLIEEYIKGVELSVPVLKCNNEFIKFPIVGIILEKVDIFNSKAKNEKAFNQVIPYELDCEKERILRDFTEEFYKKIDFRGLLRIDFIFNEEGLYFLEANSYPNLDDLSGISVPSAKKIGLSQIDLINIIMRESN